MKKVIITGATGAIGTALIELLVNNNIEVLVISRPDSKRKSNILNHPLVSTLECSLDSYASLENLTTKEYDVFYHFAWTGTTGEERNNMFLQNLNIKFSLDAVALAKRFGCKRFIGAGSQAEYGRCNEKLTPNTPAFPENGYGIAKLCAGNMTRIFAEQIGVEHIWTRILSVYGPNDGKNSLVSMLIDKLSKNIPVDVTAGEQVWDYLYSKDAADALYRLGENGISDNTYVIGSGESRLLKDFIQIIRDIINPECEINFGAIPYSDKQVMNLECDISKLTTDTGFSPKYSFYDGIIDMLNSKS